MLKIRNYPLLGKPMRIDEPISELGENTFDKLRAAIERGEKELSLQLADYARGEGKGQRDVMADWLYSLLDWIAKNYGEEGVPMALRHARSAMERSTYTRARKSATPMDRVIMFAEGMRAHNSCGPGEKGNFKIWEEPDRYVMEFDPCGTGGRLNRGPLNGSGSRVKPPYNLGVTSKPYPWSWSKANIPYYCLHCCVWNEIMAIEATGYPNRVTECPEAGSNKPCYRYIYKDPNLIPAEYFERVGFNKDPSKFKKGANP